MGRDYRAYLLHILDSIGLIEKYVEGLSFEEFAGDQKTIDAVIRNLEIIGEASSKLPRDFREKYPDVPWRSIIGLRNILIHNYMGVDVEAVWGNIKKDIPLLKEHIRSIVEKEGAA